MGVNLSSVGCYHKLVSFRANKKEFNPLTYCIPACRFTCPWHGRQALTQTLLCWAKVVAPGAGSERPLLAHSCVKTQKRPHVVPFKLDWISGEENNTEYDPQKNIQSRLVLATV
jgi:hypothetical protein